MPGKGYVPLVGQMAICPSHLRADTHPGGKSNIRELITENHGRLHRTQCGTQSLVSKVRILKGSKEGSSGSPRGLPGLWSVSVASLAIGKGQARGQQLKEQNAHQNARYCFAMCYITLWVLYCITTNCVLL